MKTNRILFAAAMSALLVGCSQEDSLGFTNDVPVVYTGSMEKTTSRVLLDQDYMMNWELGDELSIFPKFDINNQYKVIDVNDNGVATFEYVDYVENPNYTAIENTYAVYPYYAENKLEGDVITTSVPTEVDYEGMEKSIQKALMSAKSSTGKLGFTNAQGILRLRLNAVTPFKYGAIQSIKLESVSGKLLSGTAQIDYAEGATPVAKIVTGESYLLINVAEELQNDLPAKKDNKWAEFYIPVVPTEFAINDLKLTITWKNGGTYEKTAGIVVNVERKKIYTLRHTIGGTPTYEGELEGAEEDPQVWDGETQTIPEPVADPTTGEEYYPITKASDLAGMAALVNGTVQSRAADNQKIAIKLTSDIDLAGNEWTPIGTSENPYKGTFDGNGYTIKNLVITGNNSFVGLFGNTNNGEIKNLTVENAMVSGRLNVGVVAGQPYTSKYTNITVKGHVEVNGFAYVGGVGGKNAYADWTDITVNVDETSYVKANSIENGTAYRTYVGGVVGFNGEGGHSFTNITSNIDVTGSTCDVGGLFGIAHYGNQFVNCSSSGDVEITDAAEAADAEEMGGIAGVWNNGGANVVFTGCSFTGTLKANIEDVDLTNNTIVGKSYSTTGSGRLNIDGKIYVASADALVADLEAEKDVTLANNIKIDPANMSNAYGTTGINVKNGQTIDGNGYTLDIKGAGGTWDSGINTTGGLIKNITVTGSFRGIFINHNSTYSEKVVLENVTTTGTVYTISCDQGTNQGLEATNCTFKGWTSYAATLGTAKFTNCTFGEGSGYAYCRPYAPTEFIGCEFEEGFEMDPRAAVTFENCTLNGVALTAENLATLVTDNIANASVK